MTFRPKFITFDCYGTLIRFRMDETARAMFADRLPEERMAAFCADFSHYRYDEVMGDWRPYSEVLQRALHRTCKRHGITCTDEEGLTYYKLVPTWGPHADTTAGLAKIADKIPLVILSNAANEQIHKNVELLGVPFHRVYTAEMAQAYKPRYQAFEFLLDSLGCGPEDILHVSSSLRYDLMPAEDLGIMNKVYVNRGHGHDNPKFHYTEISDIGGLAGVVGL